MRPALSLTAVPRHPKSDCSGRASPPHCASHPPPHLPPASPGTPTGPAAHASDPCHAHGAVYPANAALGLFDCVCSQCYDAATNCSSLLPDCKVETRVAESTLFTPWFTSRSDALEIEIGPVSCPRGEGAEDVGSKA